MSVVDQMVLFYPLFLYLINGNLADFFKSSKGLRQGDPLSPYLFMLVMDALSILLGKATKGGYISGYEFMGKNGTTELIIFSLLMICLFFGKI